MKRKAENNDWDRIPDFHPRTVRPNHDDFSRAFTKRNLNQLRDYSCDYQTPMKRCNVNVMTSTPFSNQTSRASSRVPGSYDVIDGEADVELRRIVDNFVSIYEQLDQCEGKDVKPNYSYTELAYLAMLRSPNFCLPITEIYRYIQSRFLFFENSTRKHWKNAVRHSLAKTMCFTKIPIGRGTSNCENLSRSTYLWCIIPNSIGNFARGDYRPSVDKESGTNTLRWGYMRVNAGQFWNQVGNYIANRMTGFRRYLQQSHDTGQIFEQQVCRLHGLNPRPVGTENQAFVTGPANFRMPANCEQISCYGDNRVVYHRNSLSRVPEGAERKPFTELNQQGGVSNLPIREFVNVPTLQTLNSFHYGNDGNIDNLRPVSVNDNSSKDFVSSGHSTASYSNGQEQLLPFTLTMPNLGTLPQHTSLSTPNPGKLIPPLITTTPNQSRLSQPPSMTSPKRDLSTPPCSLSQPRFDGLTPPPPVTRFHRSTPTQSAPDKNDSGFESCSSTPESDQRPCNMSGQPIKNYTETFSVRSCDLFDEGIQLDFSDLNQSGFNEPDLSDFCERLLSDQQELKCETETSRISNTQNDTDNSESKGNIPKLVKIEDFSENPFSIRQSTPQTENRYHGNWIVSGQASQSLFGSPREQLYPWSF